MHTLTAVNVDTRVEVYMMITSNEYEDELPMKRHDLHQSESNLHGTILFFRSVFTLSF